MGKIQKCYKKSGCYCQRLPELIKEKHLLKRNVFVSHKSETNILKRKKKMNGIFLVSENCKKNDTLMGRMSFPSHFRPKLSNKRNVIMS